MLKITPFDNLNFYGEPSAKRAQKSRTKTVNTSDKNPVSKTGERLKLANATFVTGLGFGLTMLAEAFDGGFSFEHVEKQGRKLAEKNYKNASRNKREWMALISSFGLLAMFVGGCAFLYTLFKTPKIMYDGKVNAHVKGKDMDVYIKGNRIEKELLSQMNDKAKSADAAQKQKLKEQYIQMRMAKNKLPAFIELENKK